MNDLSKISNPYLFIAITPFEDHFVNFYGDIVEAFIVKGRDKHGNLVDEIMPHGLKINKSWRQKLVFATDQGAEEYEIAMRATHEIPNGGCSAAGPEHAEQRSSDPDLGQGVHDPDLLYEREKHRICWPDSRRRRVP